VASATGLRGSALRARLEGTTDDLGAVGYDTQFGHGRLNSYRAVTGSTLSEGPPPPPPEPLAASFTFSCNELACSFDGSGSTGDSNGSPRSWAWTFGDGDAAGSGVTTNYIYPGAGDYTVRLTVGDGSGTDVTSDTVSCKKRGKKLRCN